MVSDMVLIHGAIEFGNSRGYKAEIISYSIDAVLMKLVKRRGSLN